MSEDRRAAIWVRVGVIYAELEKTGDKAARASLVTELHELFSESNRIVQRNIQR